MAYKPSPRPTFDRPTHIPYAQVTRHLWGDEASGTVDDWIYVSSDKIHQLVFGLAPGQAFRHSPEFRTVFGADEVLYVLAGRFGCANPETGEVQVAEPGEAIFFRRDTWHHGFSLGTEPLARVMIEGRDKGTIESMASAIAKTIERHLGGEGRSRLNS